MSRIGAALRFGVELGTAFGLLVLIEYRLRRGSLPATCQRLGLRLDLHSAAAPVTNPPVLPQWTRVRVRAVLLVTARWPAGDTCLRLCLVLGQRLRRLDPVLRIGVRRDAAGGFSAHSWLEIDGRTWDVTAADFAVLGRAEA